MSPSLDEWRAWFPVIRDYALLVCGVLLGVYGIVTRQAGLASIGWGLVGIGAGGRANTGLP